MAPQYSAMRPQHSSLFSYSLTRPYPFPWFTWVVVIGGIISTVFFSALNLAANGYLLKTIYTTNPNATLEASHWYDKAPWSWTSRLSAGCEAQNLAIGTPFFTTNLGLSYSFNRVYQTAPDGTTKDYPAVPYLNNTLENCSVSQIYSNMQRKDRSTASGAWWSWGRTTSTATVLCTLYGASKPMTGEFKTTFITNPTGPDFSDIYVRLDNQTAASQWWGAQLLNSYYGALTAQMATQAPANGTYDNGAITLTPGNSHDITSLDFFNFTFNFQSNTGGLYFPGTWEIQPISAWVNGPGPDIGLEVDGFAKSFYSAVLVDLGQTTGPNALTNATALQHLLRQENNTMFLPWESTNILGQPTDKAYELFSNHIGPLGTTPATIYQQYACSVPEQKSPGSLFISILIADLVFLQALFQLLHLGVTYWGSMRDQSWNYCPGCKAVSVDS
ncbi:hypothetical protein BDZ45DRAFT_184966 [Acephala macrosclerotiorum]|nr:hypothetical protein BDZ45DRAFT_184966 [Acephala macrosclerotiorum]